MSSISFTLKPARLVLAHWPLPVAKGGWELSPPRCDGAVRLCLTHQERLWSPSRPLRPAIPHRGCKRFSSCQGRVPDGSESREASYLRPRLRDHPTRLLGITTSVRAVKGGAVFFICRGRAAVCGPAGNVGISRTRARADQGAYFCRGGIYARQRSRLPNNSR